MKYLLALAVFASGGLALAETERGKVKRVSLDGRTISVTQYGQDREFRVTESTWVRGATGYTVTERMKGIKEGTEITFERDTTYYSSRDELKWLEVVSGAREAAFAPRDLIDAGSTTGLIVWGLIAAVSVGLIVTSLVSRWRKLRPSLFNKSQGVQQLEQPGLLTENLNGSRWARAFASTVEWAGQILGRGETSGPREAAAVLKAAAAGGDDLADLTREAALNALKTGQLQSLLVTYGGVNIYLLVFPGRHEHPRQFRRYEPFAEGWPGHAAWLRHELAGDGRPAPLLSMLYFLNPKGSDGTALLAYEGDQERLLPGDLVEESEAGGGRRLPERCEFRLA
jgi:hypothetical protein